eukprot:179233-Hanusia_phi.AAC.1
MTHCLQCRATLLSYPIIGLDNRHLIGPLAGQPGGSPGSDRIMNGSECASRRRTVSTRAGQSPRLGLLRD